MWMGWSRVLQNMLCAGLDLTNSKRNIICLKMFHKIRQILNDISFLLLKTTIFGVPLINLKKTNIMFTCLSTQIRASGPFSSRHLGEGKYSSRNMN